MKNSLAVTIPSLYDDDDSPPRCLTPEPIPPDSPACSLLGWAERETGQLFLKKLPVEMVSIIRSVIPYSHLYTHLSFSWSCGAHEKEDNFWRKVCIAYGVGKPRNHSLATVPWRELAITIGEHHMQCSEETFCGGASIGRNTWHKVEASKRPFQEPLSPPEAQALARISGFSSNIGLRDGCDCNSGMCDCQDDLGMYDWSRAHPAAVCAFATEVPMKQLTLKIPEASAIEIYNSDGVTVWDVMIELRRAMESKHLTVEALLRIFSLPDLYHLSQRFEALKLFRLRDLLPLSDVCHGRKASRVNILLRQLGTTNRPFEVGLDSPVLLLLPPSSKVSDVLSRLQVEFPGISDMEWFSHMKEFQTVASTFNTLHAKLTGIRQLKPNCATYTTSWGFALRQSAWVRYLATWPDEWMNFEV